MGNELLPQTPDDAEQLRQFEVAGQALLDSYGAGHLGGRELSIVHGDKVITGTVASALGGRCPEFTTFAESMLEVAGPAALSAGIE